MTTAREWIAILQSFDPNEEIIAMVYSRELFGDKNLVAPDGTEYDECPKEIWDTVAEGHELRDWLCEQIHDDILSDLQDALDAKEAK